MRGKVNLAPCSDGFEFAKRQNFFFLRNKDLYLLFYPRLSLIFVTFFVKTFLVFLLKVFGSLAMPNFIVVVTNFQSLNPVHTGQPIVC